MIFRSDDGRHPSPARTAVWRIFRVALTAGVAAIVSAISLSGARPSVAAEATLPAPVTIPVEAKQVSEHVWFVQGRLGMVSRSNQGFNSNAAFVVTSAGVVVFDALGTPPLGLAMQREIARITDQPVVKVVISHFHADHFYGVAPFKAAGAQVIAQAAVRDYLATSAPDERLAERRQSLAPWVDETTRLIAPDHLVESDESFELGGVRFRLRRVGPGHTNEDLAMYVDPDGVLMAGDLMVSGRLPFVGNADSDRWLAAIDALAEPVPRIILPGHGNRSDNAARDLDLTRQYLQYLQKTMGAAADELMSFDEAYAATDWSAYAWMPAFDAANRPNAYNVFLQMQRRSLEGIKR